MMIVSPPPFRTQTESLPVQSTLDILIRKSHRPVPAIRLSTYDTLKLCITITIIIFVSLGSKDPRVKN